MKNLYSFKTLLTLGICVFAMLSAKTSKACYANFTYTGACAGDTVWFYAADLYAIYTWDFGDSTSEVNINHDTTTFHVYDAPGTYIVSLFVNIGAEWDYRTEVITIGEDCFHTDFTYSCGGSGYEYFYNTSVGSSAVWWDFGDQLSGVNNISSLNNPYHQYTTPGTYLVTLITSDGSDYDTLSQYVFVELNCPTTIGATIYPNTLGICEGDSTGITVSYTGTITSYSWDFGDPASGAANTSSLDHPTHHFSSPGTFIVTLIISNGVETDTISTGVMVVDCTVWPGDVNGDGEVNAEDVFPLGMFYANTGPLRNNATSNFTSQPSADWQNMMYLQRMVNEKMADCNGDGNINNLDLNAINTNYGMRHNNHNNKSAMPEARPIDPSLYIEFAQSQVQQGTSVTAPIYLGTAAIPVAYLYGFSFTINYDPALIVPGSVSINLSNNWLGNSSNELTITHDDYANGKIDAAVVRYDKVQVASGYGQIGTITFQLKANVSGTLNAFFSPSAKVLTTNMYGSTVSSNMEIFKPVNLVADDLLVLNLSGINDQEADNSVNVFPNPANGMVNVMLNNTEVSEITLLNSPGQIVYATAGRFTKTFSINTADYAAGIYTLSCKTANGFVVKKVSIVR